MKKKLAIVFVVLFILLCVGVAAAVILYFMNYDREQFLKNTTLNGIEVSDKTPEELADMEERWLVSLNLRLTEGGETALEGALSDMGYSFDRGRFLSILSEDKERQKSDVMYMIRTLILGDDIELRDAYKLDKEAFENFLKSESFAVPRVESREADYVVNKKTDLYEVVRPIQGNMIDDGALQDYSIKKIASALSDKELPEEGTIELEVPSEVYSSKIVSMDTTELEANLPQKNVELRKQQLREMNITYEFGNEKEVLDGEKIVDWVQVSDDLSLSVDDEAVKAYVEELGFKYNTRYMNRNFTTTYGSQITIDASRNEYGYTINPDEEAKQLKEDILSRQSLSREPIYYNSNTYGNPLYYSRNGMDDLNGTYVEINLSAQHLWYYMGGKLVVESDLVSGDISNGTGTATGCFPLAFKKSPATLEGQNANDEWSSDVDYWMPFFAGQGMHDATWRGSFGGTIYKYDGSHGCVNLPYSAAQTIYNNITPGTAIILYY